MDRRNFLQRAWMLLGAAFATPAPSRAATQPGAALLQRSPLAGFQYHAGERLSPLLAPGAALPP